MNKKKKIALTKKDQLTTAAGRPVGDNQNSLTVGPRGPIVLEDFLLFRLMDQSAQKRLIDNIAVSMANVSPDIQERQLQHFVKADPVYGRGVAEALGLKDWANYVPA